MTREERLYCHKDLVKIFNEWVSTLTPTQREIMTLNIQQFEEKYMSELTDNAPVPQHVFRMFVRSVNIDGLLDQIRLSNHIFRGNWTTWADVPTVSTSYPADKTGNKKPLEGDFMVVLHADDYGSEQEYKDKWMFVYEGLWLTSGKLGWKPIFNMGMDLTDAQKAAINSGITADKVSLIGTSIQPDTSGTTKSVKKVWTGSKQEYNALTTLDENTMYYIY